VIEPSARNGKENNALSLVESVFFVSCDKLECVSTFVFESIGWDDKLWFVPLAVSNGLDNSIIDFPEDGKFRQQLGRKKL